MKAHKYRAHSRYQEHNENDHLHDLSKGEEPFAEAPFIETGFVYGGPHVKS